MCRLGIAFMSVKRYVSDYIIQFIVKCILQNCMPGLMSCQACMHQ